MLSFPHMRTSTALFIPFALSACSDPSIPLGQPEGWDAELRIPIAPDQNPAPHITEISLTASQATLQVLPGISTSLWTYDGSLPGPLIRAKAGDTLIAHFKNNLPAPTTIHWHGIRAPNSMDGVPGHTQPEVLPGETFDYIFALPDPGLYWYHPHVDSAIQVGFGLYGALWVEDPNEPADLGDPLILVLSDIGINDDGALVDPTLGGDTATLFGREGQYILVNGKRTPTLKARPGMRQRWLIVNTAKSRYFQLELEDHSFTQIGNDGGLLEHPIPNALAVLAPGERADMLVSPRGNPGDTLALRWIPFDRGYGSTEFRDPEPILYVRLEGEEAPETAIPDIHRPIEPLNLEGSEAISLTLGQTQGDNLVLTINDQPSWNAVPLQAMLHDTQIWTIQNTMAWSHPFHLHGYFFQPLDEQNQPIKPLGWKDTLDVPYQETRRFAVRFDDRPGLWMFHCHVLDHADAGMMGMIQVQ